MITKNDVRDRALHLCEFLEFVTDTKVLVCAEGDLGMKFMAADGSASPLYVSGSTLRDLYDSMCAIEDAISFTIEAGRED